MDKLMLIGGGALLAASALLSPLDGKRSILTWLAAALGAFCFAAAGLDTGWTEAESTGPGYAFLVLQLAAVAIGVVVAALFAACASMLRALAQRVRSRASGDALALFILGVGLSLAASFWLARLFAASPFAQPTAFASPELQPIRDLLWVAEVFCYVLVLLALGWQLWILSWVRKAVAGKLPHHRVEPAQSIDSGLPVIVSHWAGRYPRVLIVARPGEPERRVARIH
jgi:hypothetical protein